MYRRLIKLYRTIEDEDSFDELKQNID